MGTSINVNNLSFGYLPKERIFNDVSFSVNAGQFLGIIGPNGGGKSTLLKLLLGLLEPWGGSIMINNAPPPTPRVGYVPQVFQFDKYFPITAYEVVLGGMARNLSVFGRYTAKDRSAATIALERVGLVHLADHPFGSLSGCEAQRVLIARALAQSRQSSC